MKIIKIDLFRTIVIMFSEDGIIKIEKKVNSIMKKYRVCFDKTEDVEFKSKTDFVGAALHLKPTDNNDNATRVKVIALNMARIKDKKTKIEAITHEIRHVVDSIIRQKRITDKETPAYLTGYISSKLLEGEF